MANFTHKGVEIEFSERSADFCAVVNGKPVRSDSLQAMKRRIDAAAAENFQPFTALRERSYEDPKGSPELVKVKILHKHKDARGGSRWDRGGFVDEAGKSYRNSLLPDTPEAIALWKSARNADAEYDKASKARQKARDAVPYIKFESD